LSGKPLRALIFLGLIAQHVGTLPEKDLEKNGGGDDLPRAREISSEKLATCHCQRRYLPHVIIGKAPAWLQHCADTF
jgi:hypothetical protein